MAYETIGQAPSIADFELLSEHQSRTPGTFFGGKPILHLHSPASKIRIHAADLASQPDFTALTANNGSHSDAEVVEISSLEVWVTSQNLIIYSRAQSAGLRIFYPTISIHAQDGDAVLLELNLSDSDTADDDLVFLQLRLVPDIITRAHPPLSPEEGHEADAHSQLNSRNGNGTSSSPVVELYDAISACQELNPDPPEHGEGQGFDPTAPGATGWITSENMQDFVDENGEFRMPDGVAVLGGEEGASELGEGAGRTRTATEVGDEDEMDDGSKWQRTG